MSKHNEFLKELKTLFEKYDAEIDVSYDTFYSGAFEIDLVTRCEETNIISRTTHYARVLNSGDFGGLIDEY